MSGENPGVDQDPQRGQDPVVREILGDLYKAEKIFAQKVEHLGAGEIKVTFVFPQYERTVEPLDHVSMSQMHEAILEGLYCCIGEAIKSGAMETPIEFESFQANKSRAIYFEEKFSFRKMLKANEPAELKFKVINVEEKRLLKSFYAVTVKIDGFMRGEVTCLLEKTDKILSE